MIFLCLGEISKLLDVYTGRLKKKKKASYNITRMITYARLVGVVGLSRPSPYHCSLTNPTLDEKATEDMGQEGWKVHN